MIRLIRPVFGGIRNDSQGQGHFGASRSGREGHVGVDLVAPKNCPVYAPCDGVVGRIGQCYPDTKKWQLVEIEARWGTVRVLYVSPVLIVADAVVAGRTVIGYSQGISERYPENENRGPMLDHIHLEIRLAPGAMRFGKNGGNPSAAVYFDPAVLFDDHILPSGTMVATASATVERNEP